MNRNCPRCGNPMRSHTMSMFNTDEICISCKEDEVKHPMYDQAREAEREQIKKGNYNYEGIGLPEDLAQKYSS